MEEIRNRMYGKGGIEKFYLEARIFCVTFIWSALVAKHVNEAIIANQRKGSRKAFSKLCTALHLLSSMKNGRLCAYNTALPRNSDTNVTPRSTCCTASVLCD